MAKVEGWEILQCKGCDSRCKLILNVESLQDPSDFPSLCIFNNATCIASWKPLEE
jgi:hypothetical protein